LLLAGALKETLIDPFPRVAATFCGTPGKPAGVIVPDAVADAPVPTLLVAVTLHK
jgi:hypothetical protein